MEHLTFKAATIAADLGEFEAIISTASVDRDGDVVDPAAMVRALHVWTETGKVIPLHWNHKSEPEDIVGYVNPDSAMQTGGEVSVTGRVDLDSPRGPEVWRLIKSGSIGFSYGYLVSEAEPRQGRGRNITAMDIFEVSVTPAPANADTRVLSWKSLGADPDLAAFKREFAESVRVHMNGDPGESLRDKAVRYEREHAPIQVAEFPC
jgi:HK97 family phage prohead protease